MVKIEDVDLDQGERYTAEELRSIFGKSRAGRGIETLYDENDRKYLRLFSKEKSEYSDNLEADPMRYVGEKNMHNPSEDQVLKGGNGALDASQNTGIPIFLFEKVSDNPVKHLFHGRVEVVDYEHNYRPQKDLKEYDFYLKLEDENEPPTNENPGQSSEDLAPGPRREIDPESREVPDTEERITYKSQKKSQAEAANEHENTVAELRDQLEATGWECMETDETDILATADSRALVIEVKSIDEHNEKRQIRKALGQSFENSYRDVVNRGWGDRELIQCIALSQVPSDKFSGYIEFLQSEGIEVLWSSEDGPTGHPESVDNIF